MAIIKLEILFNGTGFSPFIKKWIGFSQNLKMTARSEYSEIVCVICKISKKIIQQRKFPYLKNPCEKSENFINLK